MSNIAFDEILRRSLDEIYHYYRRTGADVEDPALKQGIEVYNGESVAGRAKALADYVATAHRMEISGSVVADYGSGFGGISFWFAIEGKASKVWAVEVNADYALATRAVIKSLEMSTVVSVVSDIQCVDLPSGSIDVAIVNDVLMVRSIEPRTLLSRVRDHLRPGGVLCVKSVNRLFGKQAGEFVKGTQYLNEELADAALSALNADPEFVAKQCPYSVFDMLDLIGECGFDELRYKGARGYVWWAADPPRHNVLSPFFFVSGRRPEHE